MCEVPKEIHVRHDGEQFRHYYRGELGLGHGEEMTEAQYRNMERSITNLRERINNELAHRFDCTIIVAPYIPSAVTATAPVQFDIKVVMSNGSPGTAVQNMVFPVCYRIFNSEKETWLVL